MRIKKFMKATLVFALTAMVLTACGQKDTGKDSGNNTGDGTQVEEGGETAADDTKDSAYPGTAEAGSLTINITSEPPQMFSVNMTDTTSFTVLRHVVENLIMLDPSDNPIPGVAKDWTISDDQLVYTFNLREDMKWSNGEPVTAHDFTYAWTKLLTAETGASYAYFGYVFKNGQAFHEGNAAVEDLGFKALSDYQLEVTLENPTSYFLNTLAFGVFAPLNEKAYNEFGEAYGTDANKMVYNGPFVMSSWSHESEIVLTKNPDFYDAANIELEQIKMVMIGDSNAALNSFKAGEVDVVGVNGDQAKMMGDENYPISNYDDGSTFYLELNLNNEFLANKNLRKALAYGIDKEAFVNSIVKNSSKAASSLTAPAINGLDKKFYEEVGTLVPALDVEAAKAAYALALQELGVDTLTISMICDDTDAALLNAAFVQEQLKVNIGLELVVESMPFKSRVERMQNKDFDIVFAGWGPDYNDPMTFLDMFETGNGNNNVSYTNEAYDELLDKVRVELDPATRFGYLVELEKILAEDMPIAPIYWRVRDYVVSGKVESGVVRTAFQDMNYRNVKLVK